MFLWAITFFGDHRMYVRLPVGPLHLSWSQYVTLKLKEKSCRFDTDWDTREQSTFEFFVVENGQFLFSPPKGNTCFAFRALFSSNNWANLVCSSILHVSCALFVVPFVAITMPASPESSVNHLESVPFFLLKMAHKKWLSLEQAETELMPLLDCALAVTVKYPVQRPSVDSIEMAKEGEHNFEKPPCTR